MFRERWRVGIVLLIGVMLGLTACGDVATPSTQESLIAAAPTNSPINQLADPTMRILMQTPRPAPSPTPSVRTDYLNPGTVRPDYTPIPTDTPLPFVSEPPYINLPYAAKQSANIVIVSIDKFNPLVWTTPDGKEPTAAQLDAIKQSGSTPLPRQLSPTNLTILRSFKGQHKEGAKLTILLEGAPGAKRLMPDHFNHKVGDKLLLFVEDTTQDYRYGKGITPLLYPKIDFVLEHWYDDNWALTDQYGAATKLFSEQDIVQAVNNPLPTPPSPIIPTPVLPKAKRGETVNLVQLYGLDKTKDILIKGSKAHHITDSATLQQILQLMSQPTVTLTNPASPQSQKYDYILFELQNGSSVGFIYEFNTGQFLSELQDVAITMPPQLTNLLGLIR